MYHCKPVVKLLADSEFQGERVTTLEVEFWRPIQPHIIRHRALSLCFQSSRATPTNVLMKRVQEEPWGPAYWKKNQKGMVGLEIEDSMAYGYVKAAAEAAWTTAAKGSASIAFSFQNQLFPDGQLAKEVTNRVMEPYMSIKGVITATQWDNFFKLRISKAAQGETCDLAKAIKSAIDSSTPHELGANGWHLPYISEDELVGNDIESLVKASAARCARVSYKAFDGSTDIKKDVALCEQLIRDGHLSPLEMVAVAKPDNYIKSNFDTTTSVSKFLQFRKVVENGLSIQSFA